MEKTIDVNEYPVEQLLKKVLEGETVSCELKDEEKIDNLKDLYVKHEEEKGVDIEDISYWYHKDISKNLIIFRANE